MGYKIKEMMKHFDETWNAKIDREKLIERYHKDALVGDEKMLRRKQLRIGEAVRLIENMESAEQKDSVSDEELLRAWIYWFVCLDTYKYWLDVDEARADFGIKELVEKYVK